MDSVKENAIRAAITLAGQRLDMYKEDACIANSVCKPPKKARVKGEKDDQAILVASVVHSCYSSVGVEVWKAFAGSHQFLSECVRHEAMLALYLRTLGLIY